MLWKPASVLGFIQTKHLFFVVLLIPVFGKDHCFFVKRVFVKLILTKHSE